MRTEYQLETESFKDDAVAVLNGCAIALTVMGAWTSPILLGIAGLAVAVLTYPMSSRNRGGTILAVLILTFAIILLRYVAGYSLA
ncbi:MAG TPA: hypothetical protein VKV34_04620 [Thermoleophilia bacterium]|jgi:hypothetical protein|nr:hypothetical protein [Thermoleophilia bacterium]